MCVCVCVCVCVFGSVKVSYLKKCITLSEKVKAVKDVSSKLLGSGLFKGFH